MHLHMTTARWTWGLGAVGRVVAAALCLTAGTQASATVFNWINTAGGSYITASNWSPAGGPPNDASDTAIFNLFAVYTVSMTNLGAPATVTNNLEVTATTVTFDMFDLVGGGSVRAFDYSLTSTTAAAHIGSLPGSFFPATLVLDGAFGNSGPFTGRSTVSTDGFLQIGRDANSKGILELNGADWTSTNTTFVGLNGTGTMTIRNNSTMTNLTGFVGFSPGSSGTVTIDSGGRWDNSGALSVGFLGSGSITANGVLTNDGDAVIGGNGGSSGSVVVNDAWFVGGSLFVGGGAVSPGGSGSLSIGNFGSVNVGGDMKVHSTATFGLNNGFLTVAGDLQWLKPSTLTINGDDVINAGQLTIGAGGSLNYAGNIANFFPGLEVGQINAPAGSMTWTSGDLRITNGDFSIDDTAPIGGLLTLNADRPLRVSGALRVGADGEAGNLFIIDGVQVTSGSGQMGNTAPRSTMILVAVNQPGSTWTMTGDLTMGSVAGGGAQLHVTEEAVVSNDNAFVSPDPGLHSELLIQSTTGVSTWDNSGSVYLGGNASTAGGTAILDINAGGVVAIGTELRVWDQAIVTVDTGSLTTPLLDLRGTLNYTGTLNLTGAGPVGALALNGGTINADVIDFGANALTGSGALNGVVIVGGDVTATGNLTLGDAASLNGVQIGGNLIVGAQNVTINKLGFFTIGSATSITGGSLTVSDGVAIPVGAGLSAFGAINGRVVQQSGSTIFATGDLTLGDASATDGYFSDGVLLATGNTVTLLDANEAVLGSRTVLGDQGTSGNVAAANGAVLEFGKNIEGFGTVNTPNDPFKPFINNGDIAGDSPAEPITLTGYVKGVGTLDNVVITGTDAPGFSIATVSRGSVTYAGTLEIELAASGLDIINHAGTATLGGVLDLSPVSGFTPGLGDTFQFLTSAIRVGTFASITGADLGGGLAFDVLYGTNDVTLQVINALLDGDLNGDGFVGVDDLNIVLVNWNQNVTPGDLLAGDPTDDGFVGVDDLNVVLVNWNNGTPPGAPSDLTSVTIPEPGAALLLGLGGLALLRRRHD